MHREKQRSSASPAIQAFTLLELSVVVAVVGLMLAAIFPALTQDQLRRREKDLYFRLDQVELALQKFVQLNNRLPCPAPRGYATGHASFGLETTVAGSCTSPGGTYNSGGYIYMGAVPTRTLGLADDYGFDPWDRAITYVVDRRATGARALNYTYPLSDIVHGAAQGTALGGITVKDVDWTTVTVSDRTTNGVLMLISHGPNGHGGYPRTAGTGTSVARYNVGVTNTYELANCNCTSAVANSASVTFYAAVPAPSIGALLNSYDDRVRYYTRASFSTTMERWMP